MPEEGMLQDLLVDESVQLELPGVEDQSSWWHGLLSLLDMLTPLSGSLSESWSPAKEYVVQVGITSHDLVIAEINVIGVPPNLRRIPLYTVKVVRYSEGLCTDEIVLDLGEPRPFRLRVAAKRRELTQQLVRTLGGFAG